MPYRLIKLGVNRYRVRSPHGVKARSTTKAKALAQIAILKAKEREKKK